MAGQVEAANAQAGSAHRRGRATGDGACEGRWTFKFRKSAISEPVTSTSDRAHCSGGGCEWEGSGSVAMQQWSINLQRYAWEGRARCSLHGRHGCNADGVCSGDADAGVGEMPQVRCRCT